MSETYTFSNPLISFLTKEIDSINTSLKLGKETKALRDTAHLTYFLDPKIKEELAEEITKLQSYFTNTSTWYPRDFLPILDKIINALYNSGYFAPQIIRRE